MSATLKDQDFLFVDRGFKVVVETQDFPVQLCVEEGVLAIKPVLRALISAKSVPDEVSATLKDQDFLFIDRVKVVVETREFAVQLCVEEVF